MTKKRRGVALEIQRLEQQHSEFESALETVEGRQRQSEVSLAQLGGLVRGVSEELQGVRSPREAKPSSEGPSEEEVSERICRNCWHFGSPRPFAWQKSHVLSSEVMWKLGSRTPLRSCGAARHVG